MNTRSPNPVPSLMTYFEEVFVPTYLSKVKPGTVNEYRKALRRFITFCGCNVRLHDVDEFLVERWLRKMIVEGLSFKTAKAWATYVRSVVRHGVPGKCLKAEGKRPHENVATTIAGLSPDDLRKPARSLLRFLEEIYVPRRMLGCKQGSIDQLRWTLNKYSKYLGRAPILDDLTNEKVSGFMAWILNVRSGSLSSTNNARRNLVSLWNYARKRGLVSTKPDDCESIRQHRKLPKAWTVDEIGRIIRAARQQTSPKVGMTHPAYVFFPALLLVGYDTGLRVNSLLSIRRADWCSDRREITAEAEFAKTAVAQTFIVSQQTSEAIHAMLAETHLEMNSDELPEFLFHWPIRKDAIHEHFRTILIRAGLYEKGEDTWHRLRKSCATHLTAAIGIEAASRQLGHSSVEMTRRYVDPRLTGHHNAADSLPRPETRKDRTA